MATQYTAGLTQGQVLTSDIMNQIGAAWETWTPAIYQPGVLTSTINVARYMRIQKLVIATWWLTITGAGTAGQSFFTSLPITAKSTTMSQGSALLFDASANTSYSGSLYHVTVDGVWFIGDWAANGVWGTAPALGVANGDQWRGTMIYEAA